jgi:hypothetical protein
MLVSYLVYSTLKMEVTCSSEMVDFNKLVVHGAISQKIVFVTTDVGTADPI